MSGGTFCGGGGGGGGQPTPAYIHKYTHRTWSLLLNKLKQVLISNITGWFSVDYIRALSYKMVSY